MAADRPRSSNNLSSAMLDQLLHDTLDPGYRAAARRKAESPDAPPRRWWEAPAVWLATVAIGVLLVMAYQQSHQSAPAREAARQQLITRINRLQSTGNTLQAQAKSLAAQVAAARDAQLAAGSSTGVRNLEVAAGAVAVTGTGMTVDLAEPTATSASPADGRPGTTPQTQVAVISDVDVRAVVNALWAGGAEAVAVNGLRLTSSSFIRVAGESIQVDFQPINSPYTISAVGDRDGLQVAFAESAIASQLKTMVAVDGIDFSFSSKASLRLPSVTVGLPHYAVRGATPTAATTPNPLATTTTTPTPTSTEPR